MAQWTQQTPRTIRVVIADEYPMVRLGLESILAQQPGIQVIASVADGRAALEAVVQSQPDILVLDVHLPEIDAHSIVRHLHHEGVATKCVLFTGSMHRHDVLPLLAAGVGGYVLKHDSPQQLTDAVRGAVSGRVVMSPEVSTLVLQEHYGKPGPRPRFGDLTEREQQVLTLLAQGHTNAGIANKLGIGIKTVGTHRTNLYQKLRVHNVGELIIVALRHNLISLSMPKDQRNRSPDSHQSSQAWGPRQRSGLTRPGAVRVAALRR